MLIKVEHTTSFTYAARIGEAYTELRVRPLSGGGQDCTSFRLVTDPPGISIRAYRDRLGNHVQHLEVLEDHDRISITALSEVSTAPVVLRLRRASRRRSSSTTTSRRRSTRRSRTRSSSCRRPPRAEGTEAERAVEVMRTVRSLLVYEPGATDVMTRADAALALGRGVCQDFAHVMLAACRRAGIPSRYVSGYLYDPLGRARSPRTPGWTSSTPSAAGSRSIRRTIASRPRPTSASPWVATTPTCRRRGASGRARRRRRSRSRCGSSLPVSARLGSELDGWRVEEYGRSHDGVPLRVFLPAGDGPVARPADGRPARRGSGHGPARAPAAGADSRHRDALGGDPRSQPGRPARRHEAERAPASTSTATSRRRPGSRARPSPTRRGSIRRSGSSPNRTNRSSTGSARRLRAGDPGADRPDRAARAAARRRPAQPARADLRARRRPAGGDRGARPLGGTARAGRVRGPLSRRVRRLADRARHPGARLRDRARAACPRSASGICPGWRRCSGARRAAAARRGGGAGAGTRRP